MGSLPGSGEHADMRAHLSRLPEDPLHMRFVEELTEQAAAGAPPDAPDYCRPHIHALEPEAL
jgi:hypothetical protein